MWSIPEFRTPQGFFRTVLREARTIREGHLDRVVRRLRRDGQFTLEEFREAIERRWRNIVQIFTYAQDEEPRCIVEVRYCFAPNLTPADCDDPDTTWDNQTFTLQTDLDGDNSCPQQILDDD